MGVLVPVVFTETSYGRLASVGVETMKRLKAEGFDVMHPLAALRSKLDPETGELRVAVVTDDLIVLFTRG